MTRDPIPLLAVCLALAVLGCSTTKSHRGGVRGPEPARSIIAANLADVAGKIGADVSGIAVEAKVVPPESIAPASARTFCWPKKARMEIAHNSNIEQWHQVYRHEALHVALYALTGDADQDHSEKEIAKSVGVRWWR